MAATFSHPRKELTRFSACGLLVVAGYLVLFCILQAPAIWYDLRPDPVRSLFSAVFGPINALFPNQWVALTKQQDLALAIVPLYLLFLALAAAPLVYLLKRMSKPGVLAGVRPRAILVRVFGVTLLSMFILLLVRGLLSSDIYSYSWYARIWVVHGASPLTHAPILFPPDPEGAFYWIGWPHEPSVYGPAWQIISGALFKLGLSSGGDFSFQVLILRLLADAAHLLNAGLVWSGAGMVYSRLHSRRPNSARHQSALLSRVRRLRQAAHSGRDGRLRWQVGALLFYAWNPLLLVEFAGSGHNDAVMLTFVLLGLWLYLKGWWRGGAVAVTTAALVKVAAIIFLPGYLWLILWDGVRSTRAAGGMKVYAGGVVRAAQAAAVVLATCVVLYIPFWEGPQTLQAMVSGPANRFYLHTIAADILSNLTHTSMTAILAGRATAPSDSLQRFLNSNLRSVFLAIFVLLAVFATWRARTVTRAVNVWGWVAIAAALTQGWFWPWYVSWALVPAALARSARLRNATLILSLSSLLLYLEEQILSPRMPFFADWSGRLIAAPPLAYAAASLLLDRLRVQTLARLPAGRQQARSATERRQTEPAP